MKNKEPKRFWWTNAHLSICHEDEDNETHREIIRFFRSKGAKVSLDESVHKIIRQGYHKGVWKGLEFYARHCKRIDSWDFFQSVNFENPNGGRYDFNREEKMPHRIHLRYRAIKPALSRLLIERGYSDATETKPLGTEFVNQKRLDWAGWGEPYDIEYQRKQINNFTSAEKQELCDGDQVYFLDYLTDRWHTGTAYHNINNMFWVVVNEKTKPRNIAGFHLHLEKPTPNLQGRKVPSDQADKRRKSILESAMKNQDFKTLSRLSGHLASTE